MEENSLSAKKVFNSFSPKADINIDGYKEVLDFSMNDPSIRNIAISGSYGSGKSSVIDSYEKTCTDRSFIHISLAHFDDILSHNADSNIPDGFTPDNNILLKVDGLENIRQSENNDSLINILEAKILNQLLHLIDQTDIPLSYFRLKSDMHKGDYKGIALDTCVFILLLSYVSCFNLWCNTVSTLPSFIYNLLKLTALPIMRVFAFLACVAFFGKVLYMGLDYIFNDRTTQRHISKLGVGGSFELEIFSESNNSCFDKYLDEVIYLFEHSNADAIVFEDLDRYETTKIFEKLREISSLLYQRENKRKKDNCTEGLSSPKFIFLIKDDIFAATDRTKFFDVIIPVIPVANAFNSSNQLIKAFQDIDSPSQFSPKLLRDISLYITDMRLILNVANEYKVYNSRLKTSGLSHDPNKLLAILIYKNLFPTDFNLLQQGKGYVYSLIANKENLVSEAMTDIKEEISDLETRIKKTADEHLVHIDELNAIFAPLSESRYVISSGGITVNLASNRVAGIKQLLELPENVTVSANGQRINITDIRTKLENDPDYQTRKEVLKDKQNLASLKAKLQECRIELNRQAALTIKELLNVSANPDEFFNAEAPSHENTANFDFIKSSKEFGLLKYFIVEGYIAEDYDIYIGYYYPNSLSVHDKKFLLSLMNRKALPEDYSLESPKLVLSYLVESDFTKPELENYSLLKYVITNTLHYTELWFKTFDAQNQLHESGYSFIISAWINNSVEYKEKFVSTVMRLRPGWLKLWVDKDYLEDWEWKTIVIDVLCFCDAKILQKANADEWLTKKLSLENLLDCTIPVPLNYVASLKELGVKFEKLEYNQNNDHVLYGILKNNCYVLNPNNLQVYLKHFAIPDNEVSVINCFTSILGNDGYFKDRILAEPDNFMSAILYSADNRFTDNEVTVLYILNEYPCSRENKIMYIGCLDTKIHDISLVNDSSLWPSLMSHCCITFDWPNIINYYFTLCADEKHLDDSMIVFINNNHTFPRFNRNHWSKSLSSDQMAEFAESVIICPSLSTERYEWMVGALCSPFGSFAIKSLSDSQITSLISLKLLPMTLDNAVFISENYPSQFAQFVCKAGPENLVREVEQGRLELSLDDTISVLECGEINTASKIQLLNSTRSAIPLSDHQYPDEVTAEIIRNHFDSSDTAFCIKKFDSESELVRDSFIIYARNNCESVMDTAKELKFVPLSLYAECLGIMDLACAAEMRKYIENSDFESVCTTNKRPTFKPSDSVRLTLEYFKRNNWISSYRILPNGKYQAYPKQRDRVVV